MKGCPSVSPSRATHRPSVESDPLRQKTIGEGNDFRWNSGMVPGTTCGTISHCGRRSEQFSSRKKKSPCSFSPVSAIQPNAMGYC